MLLFDIVLIGYMILTKKIQEKLFCQLDYCTSTSHSTSSKQHSLIILQYLLSGLNQDGICKASPILC